MSITIKSLRCQSCGTVAKVEVGASTVCEQLPTALIMLMLASRGESCGSPWRAEPKKLVWVRSPHRHHRIGA
jgi:hypothetical protein